ncbi:hypothetical protein KGF54_001380 [Candida jiufengensis]|uniref:uncharacterized protein n=1 Tax=Candida jiufengensis TaxID=497108 RepID=UPI0022253D4B|nr:uncharacterized protein KGF54_001380 [Candida jiufengensis]KAI5955878.1 hypothetical protein KGF54_001380 [Candida jiufengensis]
MNFFKSDYNLLKEDDKIIVDTVNEKDSENETNDDLENQVQGDQQLQQQSQLQSSIAFRILYIAFIFSLFAYLIYASIISNNYIPIIVLIHSVVPTLLASNKIISTEQLKKINSWITLDFKNLSSQIKLYVGTNISVVFQILLFLLSYHLKNENQLRAANILLIVCENIANLQAALAFSMIGYFYFNKRFEIMPFLLMVFTICLVSGVIATELYVIENNKVLSDG